jgi:hypothetical protein
VFPFEWTEEVAESSDQKLPFTHAEEAVTVRDSEAVVTPTPGSVEVVLVLNINGVLSSGTTPAEYNACART